MHIIIQKKIMRQHYMNRFQNQQKHRKDLLCKEGTIISNGRLYFANADSVRSMGSLPCIFRHSNNGENYRGSLSTSLGNNIRPNWKLPLKEFSKSRQEYSKKLKQSYSR